MKKAQILSALALAFALGVVAPVVSTVNTVSAYSETDGTATYTDVNNAIAFVENNANYKDYLALIDAHNAYTRGVANGAIDKLADNDTDGIVDVAGAVSKAIADAQAYQTLFGYNTANIGNSLHAEKNFVKQIDIAIASANSSDLYKKFVAIENVINNTSATEQDLKTAVRQFRVAAGPQGLNILSTTQYDDLHPDQVSLARFRGSNPIPNWNIGYLRAVDVYNAVQNAEEALAKYNNGYKLFMPLLMNSTIVTNDAKDVISGTENILLSTLDAIATNRCATTCVAHYSDWSALQSQLNATKNGRRIDESGDNYDLIFALAKAWQKASGNEEETKVVAARMAAYKTPVTVDNNDNNNNQGGGTNNGGNTTIDPNAPDTGILADGEANASTTVAMVAGIATALTAAGAGVVAYRNARRSTRK